MNLFRLNNGNSTDQKFNQCVLLVIPLVLASFGLLPAAQAVSPAPDGGYANGNTAEGTDALFSLTAGKNNTAIGLNALLKNTTGNSNTATGAAALPNNTTGSNNTAEGLSALFNNTTGTNNTAIGLNALLNNTTGKSNTATGAAALQANTGGSNNTAIGLQALLASTGSNNIALGFNAGMNLTAGSNNIDIGNVGIAGEAAKIRIGNQGTQKGTFIAGIFGAPITGSTVVVNSSGELGVATSSARFKEAIKPMDKASEAILALKPVTFRYKKDIDPEGISQFGLVAEQVEKVNPDLVARDAEGKVYTVRYEAVNAMLLNEFLKEHRTVQELKATVAQQQEESQAQRNEIKALAATVKEQASLIQKVSRQHEVSNAPQTVASNQ